MVKLRLKRYGRKRQPSYRIIAIESKSRREGRPLEELGYYNPRTKETILETGSLLKWLRIGAQPTDTVHAILKKAGIYNMLEAGEGGVVASIRIPAMAKAEGGEAPSPETAAASEAEPVAVSGTTQAPEAPAVEEAEPGAAAPAAVSSADPAGAAEETPSASAAEEGAEG